MPASVFIISETTPDVSIGFSKDKYLWMKPVADGSIEYYRSSDAGWSLIYTAAGISDAIAAHAALPNIHHSANVGITGTRTVGGFRLTFTNGLLTGFEAV